MRTPRTPATSPPKATRTSTRRARAARTAATRPEPVVPDALERCVGDVDRFARESWGRAPLHRKGDDRFVDVFSLADVDEIVTSATRRPEIRLVRDGETLPPAAYCRTLRLGGKYVDDVVDAAKVTSLVADGATLVLQSLQRTRPSVARFTAELQAGASHPVQANAYLTPSGAAGLSRHADGHDVLVLQLHGEKHWEIEGLGPVVLTPGDVLYLPVGTHHEAAAQESASLHLTVGLLRVTYRAVLARLLAGAGGLLDAPLPLGYAAGDVGLTEEIGELLEEVGKVLEATDPAVVADFERARQRPRVRHEGHLLSVLRVGDLGTDWVVRLRPGPAPRTVRGEDGRITVHLGDRIVGLPPAAGPSLEVLLRGGAARIGDLPGIDAEGQLVLARRLVREGMLLLEPPG